MVRPSSFRVGPDARGRNNKQRGNKQLSVSRETFYLMVSGTITGRGGLGEFRRRTSRCHPNKKQGVEQQPHGEQMEDHATSPKLNRSCSAICRSTFDREVETFTAIALKPAMLRSISLVSAVILTVTGLMMSA